MIWARPNPWPTNSRNLEADQAVTDELAALKAKLKPTQKEN